MVDKTVERVGDQMVPGLFALLMVGFGLLGLVGLIWLVGFLIALFTDPATAVYYFR